MRRSVLGFDADSEERSVSSDDLGVALAMLVYPFFSEASREDVEDGDIFRMC